MNCTHEIWGNARDAIRCARCGIKTSDLPRSYWMEPNKAEDTNTMEFDRNKVETDEEMIRHLWDSNCSVCSKIADRLKELSELLKKNGTEDR